MYDKIQINMTAIWFRDLQKPTQYFKFIPKEYGKAGKLTSDNITLNLLCSVIKNKNKSRLKNKNMTVKPIVRNRYKNARSS